MKYKACESELFTQVLKIVLDGNEEKVVLKELQREPEKGKLLHADFKEYQAKPNLRLLYQLNSLMKKNAMVSKWKVVR